MKRVHVTLDNVGCLSVVALAIAFHAVLVRTLGSGPLAWATALFAGIAVVSFIVHRTTRKEERRAFEALAGARCPKCGALVGEGAAGAMREAAAGAQWAGLQERLRPGARVSARRDWTGRCASCSASLSFDPESRALRVEA